MAELPSADSIPAKFFSEAVLHPSDALLKSLINTGNAFIAVFLCVVGIAIYVAFGGGLVLSYVALCYVVQELRRYDAYRVHRLGQAVDLIEVDVKAARRLRALILLNVTSLSVMIWIGMISVYYFQDGLLVAAIVMAAALQFYAVAVYLPVTKLLSEHEVALESFEPV